jgi:hypothetical protein
VFTYAFPWNHLNYLLKYALALFFFMRVALETMTVTHLSDKCDSRRIVSQDNVPSQITGWKRQTLTAGFMRRGFPKFQLNTTRIPMGPLLDVFKKCQGLKINRDGHFGTDVVQVTYWGGTPFESWLGYWLTSYVLWFVIRFSPILGFYLDLGYGSILTKPYSVITHKHHAAGLLAA